MRTTSISPASVKRDWIIVDAAGKTLGRLASQIADVLRGKHKPYFVPYMDCGDFVVVTNAEQVNLTGDKWNQKNYYNHSQYPGGLRTTTAEEMKKTYPDRLVHFAVMGMLPKNKLRKRFLKKLKVYKDANHPHLAQKPSPLKPRIANGV